MPQPGFKSLTVNIDTYNRLAKQAKAFESPHDVIRRLLNLVEQNEALAEKFRKEG